MTTLLPHPETQIEQCRHDPMAVCWACIDAVADAEVELWLRKFPTRKPWQLRANIVRGLMIGTYKVSTQARARYTAGASYGKIEGQSEYEWGRRSVNCPTPDTDEA